MISTFPWTVLEAILFSDTEAGNVGKRQYLLGYQATRLFWRHAGDIHSSYTPLPWLVAIVYDRAKGARCFSSAGTTSKLLRLRKKYCWLTSDRESGDQAHRARADKLSATSRKVAIKTARLFMPPVAGPTGEGKNTQLLLSARAVFTFERTLFRAPPFALL